jgi:Domain of unknown function (DUF5615)
MPLRYVLDENLRGPLWNAIQQHNASGMDPLDAVRVGDPPDLPLRTADPAILLWAEREGRVLVTGDRRSMATHLADHLQAGHHSPGIFLMRRRGTLAQVVFYLVLADRIGDPGDLRDRIEHIP